MSIVNVKTDPNRDLYVSVHTMMVLAREAGIEDQDNVTGVLGGLTAFYISVCAASDATPEEALKVWRSVLEKSCDMVAKSLKRRAAERAEALRNTPPKGHA